MLEVLTVLVKVVACVVIFVTGVLLLNDLPRKLGTRGVFRAIALVLITGAAAFQVFRDADAYVCALLAGIALEHLTSRSSWWQAVWNGRVPSDYQGTERRRHRGLA